MVSESRLEIKYNFKEFDKIFIKKNILKNKNFTKLHDDRIINSIYYDTNNLKCANDNLAGLSNRKKYRARWYNTDSNFNFEIKIKENKLTKKFILDKDTFISKSTISSDKIKSFLKKNHLIKICKISYLRSYYGFKNIRITYDRDIVYNSLINNKNHKTIISNEKILEIKYNNINQNIYNLNYITKNLPLLSSRNSKYLNSLNCLGILKF